MQEGAFFDAVRGPLFGGSLSSPQVYGTVAILDRALAVRTPLRHLAYMLATAFHETAATMQPILETRNAKDKANPSIDLAIKRLDNSFAAGKLPWVSKPYWRKDADGKSWLGRGLVQLTHKVNYVRVGKMIGVDLATDPDRAMDPGIAISIMFFGMTRGDFTGRPLSDYLDGSTPDYFNARRVINGTESARKVAGYAERFEQALVASGYSSDAKPAEIVKPVVSDLPPRAEPSGGGAVAAPAVPVEKPKAKPVRKSGRFWTWLLAGGISSTTITEKLGAFQLDWRVQIALLAVIVGFAIYAIATMPAVRRALGIADA